MALVQRQPGQTALLDGMFIGNLDIARGERT
jgi:hypothetical protein